MLFIYLHITPKLLSRVESVEVEQPDGSVLVYPVCYIYMLHVYLIVNNEIKFTQHRWVDKYFKAHLNNLTLIGLNQCLAKSRCT